MSKEGIAIRFDIGALIHEYAVETDKAIDECKEVLNSDVLPDVAQDLLRQQHDMLVGGMRMLKKIHDRLEEEAKKPRDSEGNELKDENLPDNVKTIFNSPSTKH